MALGNNCSSELRRGNSNTVIKKGLGFGNCTRAIGRKRIVLSHCLEGSPFNSPPNTPPRKRLGRKANAERLHLEALPQDILVRILCCVDHDDLKQLFHVCHSVREAALIAEKLHFAFSTPSSKTARLTPFGDLEDVDKFDYEAPNAPRQQKCRTRIRSGRLAGISVALFASPEA